MTAKSLCPAVANPLHLDNYRVCVDYQMYQKYTVQHTYYSSYTCFQFCVDVAVGMLLWPWR